MDFVDSKPIDVDSYVKRLTNYEFCYSSLYDECIADGDTDGALFFSGVLKGLNTALKLSDGLNCPFHRRGIC